MKAMRRQYLIEDDAGEHPEFVFHGLARHA
jgi:hypothetical protein